MVPFTIISSTMLQTFSSKEENVPTIFHRVFPGALSVSFMSLLTGGKGHFVNETWCPCAPNGSMLCFKACPPGFQLDWMWMGVQTRKSYAIDSPWLNTDNQRESPSLFEIWLHSFKWKHKFGDVFMFLYWKISNMCSLVAQQVKDLKLSLLSLRSLLWCRFSPWPGNFHMPQMQVEKKD